MRWLRNVVITNYMNRVIPVLRVSDTAPEMVRRLGLIVGGMAALVARRFLRDPKFFAVIVPLWGWLNRRVQRFARLRLGPAVVRVRKAPPMSPVPAVARTTPRVRLPSGHGWLVRALGWEAAGYGSQLAALLAEPEMVALLEAVPGVGRVLRPLGWILGVQVGPVPAKPAAAVRPRKVRVRTPRVVREKPWSPGPIRPPWQAGQKRASWDRG